eukprot:915271-Amphidinium_carterae.3
MRACAHLWEAELKLYGSDALSGVNSRSILAQDVPPAPPGLVTPMHEINPHPSYPRTELSARSDSQGVASRTASQDRTSHLAKSVGVSSLVQRPSPVSRLSMQERPQGSALERNRYSPSNRTNLTQRPVRHALPQEASRSSEDMFEMLKPALAQARRAGVPVVGEPGTVTDVLAEGLRGVAEPSRAWGARRKT